MQRTPSSCQIFTRLGYSRQNLEISSNIHFNENPSSRSEVVPCVQTAGWTDMKNLRVAFRKFAKALKIKLFKLYEMLWTPTLLQGRKNWSSLKRDWRKNSEILRSVARYSLYDHKSSKYIYTNIYIYT